MEQDTPPKPELIYQNPLSSWMIDAREELEAREAGLIEKKDGIKIRGGVKYLRALDREDSPDCIFQGGPTPNRFDTDWEVGPGDLIGYRCVRNGEENEYPFILQKIHFEYDENRRRLEGIKLEEAVVFYSRATKDLGQVIGIVRTTTYDKLGNLKENKLDALPSLDAVEKERRLGLSDLETGETPTTSTEITKDHGRLTLDIDHPISEDQELRQMTKGLNKQISEGEIKLNEAPEQVDLIKLSLRVRDFGAPPFIDITSLEKVDQEKEN